MTLEFMYPDGTSNFFNVPFNLDTPQWQFASGVFIAPNDYANLKVHIVYHYNGNPVMFDGIHLDSYFDYDNAGKITRMVENYEGNKFITVYQYGDFATAVSRSSHLFNIYIVN